jgi:hypothetical protein
MLGSGEKICNHSGMWEGAEPKCISKFRFDKSRIVKMITNFQLFAFNNTSILFLQIPISI